MNYDQARELLDISLLLPAEEHTAEMKEALALAARDPDLGGWFAARKAFDESMTEVLTRIEPPAGLRDRLVRTMEREHRSRRGLTPPRLLAIAAAFALLAGSAALLLQRGSTDWKIETLAAIAQVDAGKMPLDKWSGDIAVLREWLSMEKSPTAASMPPGLSLLKALGCKVVTINGRPASITCFALPGSSDEAHLAVLEADGATASRPKFEARDGWHLVTWTEQGRKLMLASRAPEAVLRKLFA